MHVVLCIPGPWPDGFSLLRSFYGQGLVAAGMILMELGGEHSAVFNWAELRPEERTAWKAALPRDLADDAIVSAVELQISGYGSEAIDATAALTERLLEGGGLGVEVVTGGVKTSKHAWQSLLHALHDPEHMLVAMTSIVFETDGVRSRGMQQFGLPDAHCRMADRAQARRVVREFLLRCLDEGPELLDRPTFVSDDEDLELRLGLQDGPTEDPLDPLHNPFGVCTLESKSEQRA